MPGARALRMCRSIYGARNRERESFWCERTPRAARLSPMRGLVDFRFATYRGASESVTAIGDAEGQLRFTLWTAQHVSRTQAPRRMPGP